MLRYKAVLNSDTVNRCGFRFSVGGLEGALDQKALVGIPTCLGHDMHRPIGWTVPYGLYFEPGMCRLVGRTTIAENSEEQKVINNAHEAALYKRYTDDCSPHINEFKALLGNHLSENAKYLYAGCVCYVDDNLTEKVFPKLFEKKDKDGLIYLSYLLELFTYMGHGVFKSKDSEIAVIAHRYFRKSLSIHNNLNYFLIDELVKQSTNKNIKVRISLDLNMLGFAKTYHDTIELEYWRGPKFDNDITNIKPGVSVYGSNDFQKQYYGISQTEFWWKNETDKQVLEVEELKEHPSIGTDDDSYGCRYVHSIFDTSLNSFEHFDGAIRMYSTEKMLMRIEKDIKSAGKDSVYTKLFRIDGQLSIADWKTLVCHYYQANPLIHEYFGETSEITPHIIEDEEKTIIDRFVPYSMNNGDGIRLFVTYHPIAKRENKTDRYIASFDELSTENETFKVIENDVIEVKKALNRLNCDLEFPQVTNFICSEDLYWNIPTISHRIGSEIEYNVSQTLKALKMVFDGIISKGQDKIISFSLSWERDDAKQITVSALGPCKDLIDWIISNDQIPIEKSAFRNWLETQSVYLQKYPINGDKPSLSEMICDDGVLFIKRRSIDPAKYELKRNDIGQLMIGFRFKKDEADLIAAYNEMRIDAAPVFLITKTECSFCNKDYKTCEHSKYLDNSVTENVTEFKLASVIWTDRKA